MELGGRHGGGGEGDMEMEGGRGSKRLGDRDREGDRQGRSEIQFRWIGMSRD